MVSTAGIKTGVPTAVVPAELTEGVVSAKVLSSIVVTAEVVPSVVSGEVVPKLVTPTDVELRAVHKWYPGKYLLQKWDQRWCFFLQNWCQVL